MTREDEKIDPKGITLDKAYIANHYLRACMSGAVRQGFDAVELMDSAGIPADYLGQPAKLLTEPQLTRLIKTLWRATRDEFLGLAPHRCKNGVFALMAEFCLSAQTLGNMLRRSARFYSAVYEGIDIALEDDTPGSDGLVFFRLDLREDQYDPDHLMQEFLLLMWQRFGCWLVDQQIPIAVNHFRYSAPGHFEEYGAMYPGDHHFNQPRCGFYIHSRYLDLPIVRGEEELALFLKESPAYILHRPSQDFSLQARIRRILTRYDYTEMPGLETVGQALNLTPRTIGRKLREEGTSFSQIKTALRRQYAIKLLTTEHLSIGEVSERVGFSESAAFCRAFKRWTGRSPSAWSAEI